VLVKVRYPSRVIMTENTIGGSTKRPQEIKIKIRNLPYNTNYTYFIIKHPILIYISATRFGDPIGSQRGS